MVPAFFLFLFLFFFFSPKGIGVGGDGVYLFWIWGGFLLFSFYFLVPFFFYHVRMRDVRVTYTVCTTRKWREKVVVVMVVILQRREERAGRERRVPW